MVQVDIPFAFGVGSLFAAAVQPAVSTGRLWCMRQRALAANLVFQVVFAIWLPVYLLVAHFGFQTSHMWWHGESLLEYPWLLPGFVLLYFSANLAGFAVGAWLTTTGRASIARAIFWLSLVFFGGWMAVQPARTLTIGTYQQWAAGQAPWMWSDVGLAWLLAISFFVIFGVLYVMYRRVLRDAATIAWGDPGTAEGRGGVGPAI
jgi:hypothetical protein